MLRWQTDVVYQFLLLQPTPFFAFHSINLLVLVFVLFLPFHFVVLCDFLIRNIVNTAIVGEVFVFTF